MMNGEPCIAQLYKQLRIIYFDDGLNVEGKATVGFNGNVYTGGVSSKDTLTGAKEYDYQDGIIASSESNVTFDSKTIINMITKTEL